MLLALMLALSQPSLLPHPLLARSSLSLSSYAMGTPAAVRQVGNIESIYVLFAGSGVHLDYLR